MDQVRTMELKALLREFDCLCMRWAISCEEREKLVGNAEESEWSKRILVEIDRHMRFMIGEDQIPQWLRDRGETGLSPLEFLEMGGGQRAEMLAAARQRLSERCPQDF
ncbi:hypothetical protein AAG598_13565 [Citromicrobium bathyomarinum]